MQARFSGSLSLKTGSHFTPAGHGRRGSLCLDVEKNILARINSGLLAVGDKLPTEAQLMRDEGVSRTVIREAISRLQAAGIVETRHGIGTFVLARPLEASSLGGPEAFMTIRDVIAMLEVRISLEIEAAGLAAQRRSEEDIVALRVVLAEFENERADGRDAVAPDTRFHLRIADSTGNRYFGAAYQSLGLTAIPRSRVHAPLYAEDGKGKYLARANNEHRDLLEAIERRDPESARAVMRLHLANTRERLRALLT